MRKPVDSSKVACGFRPLLRGSGSGASRHDRRVSDHDSCGPRERGAEVCLGGGWGVDALLGEQTREHSDLDLWLDAEAIEPLFVVLTDLGINRLFPWPGDRPWNFVLHDGGHLRIDLHCFEAASTNAVHYGAFAENEVFPRTALTERTDRRGDGPVRAT